jgi:acetyl esterase/lipase
MRAACHFHENAPRFHEKECGKFAGDLPREIGSGCEDASLWLLRTRTGGAPECRSAHVRKLTAGLLAATTLSAGTVSALAFTPTSVSAASPGAGADLPALSAPIQTLNAQQAASSISIKTYSYGSHSRNRLDVFAPSKVASASSTVRRPTVVLVHGGSWVKGDKSNMHSAAKQLVGEGYVAIPVNYRYATQAAWPAQREDLQAAIRYVKRNAGKFHVDTSRIVVLGSSAGAEITASALTQGNGSQYGRGMVLLSGPLDLGLVATDTSSKGAITLGKRVTNYLLRCLPANCTKHLFNTSSAAYRHDSRDPASLVITARDEWVSPQNSYRFQAAARADGVKSDLYVVPGKNHGMDNWDAAWPTIRRWIDKRMSAKR